MKVSTGTAFLVDIVVIYQNSKSVYRFTQWFYFYIFILETNRKVKKIYIKMFNVVLFKNSEKLNSISIEIKLGHLLWTPAIEYHISI